MCSHLITFLKKFIFYVKLDFSSSYLISFKIVICVSRTKTICHLFDGLGHQIDLYDFSRGAH